MGWRKRGAMLRTTMVTSSVLRRLLGGVHMFRELMLTHDIFKYSKQ